LREICDRTGALLIADEVQTGLGRTGKMFAVEHWDVEPDVICLAKALGGGLPLGAVLAKAEIMDQWPPAAQGTTFGGNPIACQAGLTTLNIIQEQDLIAHAVEVGDFIQNQFRDAQKDFPMIGDVRGKGMMVGVELVNVDGSPAIAIIKAIIKEMGGKGIVLTKCGASAIRIAPPLIISMKQAAEGVDIILSVIADHQW
jgi:4-aminobutyrate aminotransferase